MLRGDVRVLRGAYRATVSLPALVAFNRGAVAAGRGLGLPRRAASRHRVSTEEDLVVDNNYGRFEAGANLRLQGTVGRPGVTGRVELREGGEIFLLGGLYRLNASNISFTNPSAIEPDLNVSMSTRSSGAEVTVTLSGTLDRLETNVTSTDPDRQREPAERAARRQLARPGRTPGAAVGRAAGRDRPAHRPRHACASSAASTPTSSARIPGSSPRTSTRHPADACRSASGRTSR